MDMILTQTEVAAKLKISPATMRMWIRARPDLVPPCFNIGTANKPVLRFMAEDVEAHILKLASENRYAFAPPKSALSPQSEAPIIDIE